MIDRKALEIYVYEGHKDAYGVKGRHYNFAAMTDEELVREADRIEVAIGEAIEQEREAAEAAVASFEALVQDVIRSGAGDLKTALRWMVSDLEATHIQDIEHWVWEHGILFTEYGRNLVKELGALVDLK